MILWEILDILRALAPEDTALPDDPVGLLIGSRLDAPVRKVGVCLDVTPGTAARAASQGIGLLIAHHPLIYHPLRRIDPADPVGRAVTALVKADVALYAMHTNWDRAAGGINDTLAAALELVQVQPLGPHGTAALPRLGNLRTPLPLADFARFVEKALECAGSSALRCSGGAAETLISRVAVCGGAGASFAAEVQAAGAQAYVTSDVRHHEFLDAAARGLPLLDAGHGATETPGMRALIPLLLSRMSKVEVTWAGEA